MNQFIKKTLAITGLALFAACSSPLSDIEVNDSNVLFPRFSANYEWKDGSDFSKVTVFLADKNGASINLKNGTVSCNGENMHYSSMSYGCNEKFKSGKDYEFIVTLPDSTTYEGTVVGAKEIKGINWPKSLDQNKAEKLHWLSGKDRDIKIELRVQNENNSWESVHTHHVGNEKRYFLELPKMEFPDKMNGKAEIIISSIEKGNLSNDFGGGSAESTVTYTKSLTIK
jgi:hypothetical protein